MRKESGIENGLQDAGMLANGWKRGEGKEEEEIATADDSGKSGRNERERERERRGMFATLRLLRPLKIHPGILPATDLNNVVGEGDEAPPIRATVHTPRGGTRGNRKLGKENRSQRFSPPIVLPFH